MILDRTMERLRSKHVCTLELLQQTLDEIVELRDRLAKIHSVLSSLLHLQPPLCLKLPLPFAGIAPHQCWLLCILSCIPARAVKSRDGVGGGDGVSPG